MSLSTEVVESIDGWLTKPEANLLYKFAKKCSGKGTIVEIGSWKGKSTVCLSEGLRDGAGGKVHAVDPFTGSSEHGDVDTYNEFLSNIKRAGIDEYVIPHRQYSEDAAKEWDGSPIELLWIDGAHEYEFVIKDYQLWEPYLVEGGTIAFHDSTDPGVWPVLDKYIFRSKKFRRIRFIHGITYAIKGKPLPFENAIMRWLRDIKYGLWYIWDRSRKTLRKKN